MLTLLITLFVLTYAAIALEQSVGLRGNCRLDAHGFHFKP